MLDITSFRNALHQLEETLKVAHASNEPTGSMHTLIIRTALVKSYEYTYELAVKMMKRFTEMADIKKTDGTELTFRDFLRAAFDFGLIRDIDSWLTYREKRNKTSHAYADEIAQEVIDVVPSFLAEAHRLLDALEKRQRETQ